MLPTFNVAGDAVLVDKLFWKYSEPELGSVLGSLYLNSVYISRRSG